MKRLLVTGAAGFIGSNLCDFLLPCPSLEVCIMVDSEEKISDPQFCKSLVKKSTEENKIKYYKCDICSRKIFDIISTYDIDTIINLAGSTFVDESIHGKISNFYKNNYIGVHSILDALREWDFYRTIRFIHISTDEVFGSGGPFVETDRLEPQNPYAATKAAAELMIKAYKNTYNIHPIIIRLSNVFGPRQHPEKVIPNWITSLSSNTDIEIYGNGQNIRQWLPVSLVCRWILAIAKRGMIGESYNVNCGYPCKNKDLAKWISDSYYRYVSDKSFNADDFDNNYSRIRFVKDRPGHDLCYFLGSENDCFMPKKPLSRDGFIYELADTCKWYINHKEWWEPRKNEFLARERV